MKITPEHYRQRVDKLARIALLQLQESARDLGLNLKKDLRYQTSVNIIEWYCKIAKNHAHKEDSLQLFSRLADALRKVASSLPTVVLEDYYST